ncbi:MAG: sugar kinase [Deltaproteobacteria bacterium RIFOXYB12_FULL_58_9]|nr:MAG: sugar kinase [Deltaproteobacteria bacterium RIFOXYB12_FULL_58_9]
MNLLVVGTLALDSVKTPYGEREDILGGSASFAAICASYFCPVQTVGIIGSDFPNEHMDLFRSKNIDTAGVERADGATFRWSGVYESNMNIRHTISTDLNVLASFSPTIPDSYKNTKYAILGNFDPSLQLSVYEQLLQPKLVACDTMNFWIDDFRTALMKTLGKVQVLLVNDSEARQLSGEHNLRRAAQAIRKMGPGIVVIKLGEYGAILFDEHGIFVTSAFVLDHFTDPTGAGDSFAGGMFGFLAKHDTVDAKTLRQSMVMGTVMASFCVEDFSVESIRNLNDDKIRERVGAYRALTQVDLNL